jgi:hypothetical protein
MTNKRILVGIFLLFVSLLTMPIMMAQSQSSGQDIVKTATVTAPKSVHIDYLAEPPELPTEAIEILQAQMCDLSSLPGPPIPVEDDARPEMVIPEGQSFINEGGKMLAPGDFMFFQNSDLGGGAPSGFTSVVNEPSVGTNGNLVFQSGNWYAALSTDNGNTFSFVDPYTTFPSINGGFCCDQEVFRLVFKGVS